MPDHDYASFAVRGGGEGLRMGFVSPFLHVVGLAAFVILTASPALGQQHRSGGWPTLRLREDLPQGFAIHESATISTMWGPCHASAIWCSSIR